MALHRVAPRTELLQGPSRPGTARVATRSRVQRSLQKCASTAPASNITGAGLLSWLEENGASQDNVTISMTQLSGPGRPLDVTVARNALQPGDVALSMPDNLVVTLSRVFEDDALAELLTTDKLSELACLTLYMMYEKKIGKESFWYYYIKELDKQRARGPQAVESPLLWPKEELEDLLQGSPVVAAVQQRLASIEKEYNELDTVWFMAGSLFNKYPFDIPTEAFSFDLFKQAFTAVQASIVHLQGVPLAQRFALVPLGPPLLSYSSTCKAMVGYNKERKAVELVVDRAYNAGDPLYAWCGPQPNSRLLINYGIVDETNPYDRLQMTVTLSNDDPLFQQKRNRLHAHSLSTQQSFDLQRNKPLPATLLPFLRIAYCTDSETLATLPTESTDAPPAHPALEQRVLTQLAAYLRYRLSQYKHPLWKDLEILEDPATPPRHKIAARLTKIEKSILMSALEQVQAAAGGDSLEGPVEQLPAYIANLLETGKDRSGHCG